MSDATDTAEKPKADANRPYHAYEPLTLNLADSAQLQGLAEKYGNGEPLIEVLVKVGEVQSDSPRRAIAALGKSSDLEGNYAIIAKTAITRFDNVTSATERVVKIPAAS